jgi:tight adherence protein C
MSANTWAFLAAAFLTCAGTAFLIYGVGAMLGDSKRISRRLQRATSTDPRSQRLIIEDRLLQRFERFLTAEPQRVSKIQKRLLMAGYRRPSAVRVYFACKWGLATLGLVVFGVVFGTLLTQSATITPILMMLFGVALSLFATDMWITRRIAYRRIDIEHSFPDALDLLLVCIEAGHGLDQALLRVSREMRRSSAVLAEELSIVVTELGAGKERNRVLSAFAERSGVDDVAAFVTVIKQADKFGVSIADTLRVYSREMRDKRYMRAEEKANIMPIKLALGAIVFTVPPVILILIGPSVIMLVREMAKAAGH